MRRTAWFGTTVSALAIGLVGGCQVIAGLTGQDVPLPNDGGGSAMFTCSDDAKNGAETDTDCGGGTCGPCDDGERCLVGADCKDKVCTGGMCAAPTCEDKIKNGHETGTDCGGTSCPKCSAGEECETASDCVSGICTGGMCASSCTDQVKDGNETDVDCGGMCPGCVLGLTCGKHADCESGVCSGGKCVDFVAWTKRVGGMSGTDAARLAGLGIDGTGNAVIAANFTGKAALGGTSVYDTGANSSQGFGFGRYDLQGTHIWDAGYVTGVQLKSQTLDLLAVSASGSFAALGDYDSQGIDFGNAVSLPGVAPAPIQAFTVTFNASSVATSAHKYGNQSGLNGLAFGGIATNSLGSALVAVGAGNFGSYNLSTANMTNVAVHNGDLFVINFTGNWGVTFNDGGSSDGFAGVGLDPTGNVIAAGHHKGTINFGDGLLDSTTDGQGFAVKFNTSGGLAWSKGFAATPDRLAVDAGGNVILCGEFSGNLDFGLGLLGSTGTSIFVATLDSKGNAVWNKAFAVSGGMSAVTTLVTTDGMGNVLLAVNAPGATVNFGGGPLDGNFFVAKLDASGSHVWSKGFGTDKLDRVVGLAAYDDTEILVGGNFHGTLSLGDTAMSSVGASDVFLAKLRLPQ